MATEGMDDGDLDSGWLEVKKHRSGSRFSVHSASRPASIQSGVGRGGNPRRGRYQNYCRAFPNVLPGDSDPKGYVEFSSSNVEAAEGCSDDKVAVIQDNVSILGAEMEIGTVLSDFGKVPDELPKIKWGDLDDDVLLINKCTRDSRGDSKVECTADRGVSADEIASESVAEEFHGENSAEGDVSCASDVTEFVPPKQSQLEGEAELVPEPQSLNDQCNSSMVENSSVPDLVHCTEDVVSLAKDGLCVSCEGDSVVERSENVDDGLEGSKERFRQRLWCFVFENLNRAIDELYLLCELECDMEQIDEAMLVLDEAGSDFKELKSRVEDFERSKKFPSQVIRDGITKADHRRPHALSWEVRRMTTTPDRADILSSSIEAFKKIRKERAEGYMHQDLSCTMPIQKKSGSFLNNSEGRKNTTSNNKNFSEKPDAQSSRRAPCNKTKKQVGNLGSHGSAIKDGPLASASVSVEHQLDYVSKEDKQIGEVDEMKAEKPTRSQVVEDNGKGSQSSGSWNTMNAWKEKRNWEDILRSPIRTLSRVSHSPFIGRKSVDRGRVLHQKLMSPEKKRKNTFDMKREAEDRHARATRIRSQLENERVQRLQRTSEKLNRVNEWQAVRSLKMRERMNARLQRSESRHEAHLAQVSRRAGDESSKVNEVRFITSLNEENKKLILRQKLQDSEVRRAEKLQVIRTKQKEENLREEAVLERKKLLEAEKLHRIAEIQRRKDEAKIRREEERKASSAAREARAIEQLRRKEVRAKAQQEEAELLAQKLAEKLKESEQRRKFYLEQIRERASTDFRDMSSPLYRRSGRPVEEYNMGSGLTSMGLGDAAAQTSLKRRIKRIRQRLMALKHEYSDLSVGGDFVGVGFRSTMGTARAKIGRWLQELQRLRQARKEGAASIGLIVVDMIKYLEGKEPELHGARKAGLIDFIASALPASHTSRPEACQVTRYLLRLLQVVLSIAANRSYFLSQNLLPPIIPMLSASLENYIKIAASSNLSGTTTKNYAENLETIAEVLDGFLCVVTEILAHSVSDEQQLQMRDGLVDLVVSYQVIHRLRDFFALYDRPQIEGSPFPSSILLSLNLLAVLTTKSGRASPTEWGSPHNLFPETIGNVDIRGKGAENTVSGAFSVSGENMQKESSPDVDKLNGMLSSRISESCMILPDHKASKMIDDDYVDKTDGIIRSCEVVKDESSTQRKEEAQKKHRSLLLSAISETGLISLHSLLTAVLLQANNRQSSEQNSYTLPSNFEEVATGVLKILNNISLLDVGLLQNMLARPDLQMEFFHLMSFLLSHCNYKWQGAHDQVGLLLLESLILLRYFALFHAGNQEVLRWGKNPTILHKVCDLPFVFFSDPELSPILAGTLVAACFGSEQNRDVVQQELSTEMLITLLRSCKQDLPCLGPLDIASRLNQTAVEPPKRVLGKGINTVNGAKGSRIKVQQSGKMRACDDWGVKQHQTSESKSLSFIVRSRLPKGLLDKAEEFFLAGAPGL
ncbi:uncharacterized protein LOC144702200 isoform X2 [Wolffia australiana]